MSSTEHSEVAHAFRAMHEVMAKVVDQCAIDLTRRPDHVVIQGVSAANLRVARTQRTLKPRKLNRFVILDSIFSKLFLNVLAYFTEGSPRRFRIGPSAEVIVEPS